MSEFGDRFKKARQSKGISLDQIAFETRIGIRFLQAIENEDFHLLPGGIFNRGFIRSYAERVGLDAEQIVADYERISGKRDTVEAETTAVQSSNKAQAGLLPIALGFLALAIIIFYAATRSSENTIIEDQSPAIIESPPVEAEPAPLERPPVIPESVPSEEIDDGLRTLQSLDVEMEIREPTWIKLVSDGNEVVSGEVMQPGTTRRFTAQASIDITIGNAGGLILRVNDRPISSLGRRGEVREVTITPQNLNDILG
jgi:transcriptional regulator with XRE-family HTH domain